MKTAINFQRGSISGGQFHSLNKKSFYWGFENVLDSIDLSTPFDQKFEKGTFYTKQQYNKIFIEYRNANLISLIDKSPAKKILILYGAGHRRDFQKRLKSYQKRKE